MFCKFKINLSSFRSLSYVLRFFNSNIFYQKIALLQGIKCEMELPTMKYSLTFKGNIFISFLNNV